LRRKRPGRTLTRPAGFVAAVVLVFILIPASWLFLAHLAGVRANTSQGSFGLLITLSGLMATLCTLGGLVIVLASLVTLPSVESQVERRIETLLPRLTEDADRQIQAVLAVCLLRPTRCTASSPSAKPATHTHALSGSRETRMSHAVSTGVLCP